MALTLFGIKACDTIKKARAWLDAHGVSYVFNDYKVAGVDLASLERWCAAEGWERVLNRAGTTFRTVPEADKAHLTTEKAVALMLAAPSMIKRPVLEGDGHLLIGFKPELYAEALGR